MGIENRKYRRQRSMKVGQLFHAANGTSYDCQIADINSRGARIRFDKTSLLGRRVELLIKPENVKVHGRITWRGETGFGVQFDRPLSWLERHDVETRQLADA